MVQNGSALRAEGFALDRNRYIAVSVNTGSSATITDVFIRDTDTDGQGGFGQSIRADQGSSVVGTRVTALRARASGVGATGAGSSLRLTECAVRDTLGLPVDGRQREGFGAVAALEAVVVLDRCLIERNLNTGAQAETAARMELRDSVVADTVVPAEAVVSIGVSVRSGGTGILERVRVHGQRGVGVAVADPRSNLAVSDSLVRDNDEQPGGGGGIGISAEVGGRAEVVRSRVSHNVTFGVQVAAAGSDATLQDVIIEGTRQQASGQKGAGLAVDGPAIGRAVRTLLASNHQAGVIAQRDARIELTDVVVRDTETVTGLEVSGTGILSMIHAHIEASRVLALRNRSSGVHAEQEGASIRFADGAIEETRPVGRGQYGGWGASVGSTGRIELTRTRADRNVNAGVIASDNGSALLEDVAIRDTQPSSPSFQTLGRGIEVNTGGRLEARRLLLWGNHDVGVATMLLGSTRLEDAIVAAVRPVAFGFGIGVAALGPVTTDLRRVAIVDVGGAALAANRLVIMIADPAAGGGAITAEHLFIRRVQPQQIRQVMPVGDRVAYGVEVGARSRVEITSGVVAEGGWGFHQTDGELTWRRGVITGQTQAAGAVSRASLRDQAFVDVRVRGNGSDQVVVDDSLPELALPPPQAPCASPPCER